MGENNYTELIVSKIVAEIERQNITVSRMEEDLNIGKTIAFWKRGTQPTVEKLVKVLKYLGLSADEVLDISSPINRTEKTLLISKFKSDLQYISKHLSILEGEDDVYDMIRDAMVIRNYIDTQIEKYNKLDRE